MLRLMSGLEKRVDPVTGLSRRQLIALGALIPLGVMASTVATFVTERVQAACPDDRVECTGLEPGEPVVIGVLVATDADATQSLREEVADALGSHPMILGHPVSVDFRDVGCSTEEAAEAARELGSDPPDEPPSALVVADACSAAAIPVAQILSDSSVTLVTLHEVPEVPTDPEYHLSAAGLDDAALLDRVLEAIERVAVRDGDNLLIPRRLLRDQLIAEGFSPA